jgi:signal transduction histidine kinase
VSGPSASDRLEDQERLGALWATTLLDSVPVEAFDRLTRLATRTVGVPVSLVTLVEGDRQFIMSSSGGVDWAPAGASVSVDQSFCSVVVRRGAAFVTEDILEDPVGAEFPGLRQTAVRAYAGFPLITSDGHTLGALCAVDDAPRVWDEDHLQTLEEITRLAIDEIELRTTLRISERRRQDIEQAAVSIRTLHGALDSADAERLEGRRAALRLVADLAHELRTPLYAIRMLTEDLTAAAPEPLHADLQQIDATSAEALAVIDHHLDLAKASAGEGTVRVHDVRITDLLGALRGMLEPLARPEVALVLEEEPSLPTLSSDGVKLAQILRNLTTNALRHTTEGEVRVVAVRGDGDSVAFHVRDTGPGIAEADHERIFGRHEQAGEGGSAGLGLPLARRMAAMIGGSITLISSPGAGACFTLTVPTTVRDPAPGVRVTAAPYG